MKELASIEKLRKRLARIATDHTLEPPDADQTFGRLLGVEQHPVHYGEVVSVSADQLDDRRIGILPAPHIRGVESPQRVGERRVEFDRLAEMVPRLLPLVLLKELHTALVLVAR